MSDYYNECLVYTMGENRAENKEIAFRIVETANVEVFDGPNPDSLRVVVYTPLAQQLVAVTLVELDDEGLIEDIPQWTRRD